MDHSRSHRCVIPLVVIEDAAKSTRGDFRTMVDHNVERLVGAIERSKYGSHVRLLTVHYHDEIAVKSQFAPLRDIRPGALELADCVCCGTMKLEKNRAVIAIEIPNGREYSVY